MTISLMADASQSKRYFGRWFRFYASAVDDPKIQTLPDPLFRTWINLLCLASKADGVIPGGKQLSFGLRLSDALTKKRLDALIAVGLIDRTESGFTPHNWSERQFQSDFRPLACVRFGAARTDRVTPSVTPKVTSHVTAARANVTAAVTSLVTAK